MKLTPIFPHDVLPVRSGVYLTKAVNIDGTESKFPWEYSHFDQTDRIWGCAYPSAEAAANQPDYEFAYQQKQWRGIAEESK